MITELEEKIGKYKEEYAQLIAQAEAIKSGLSSVQEKVTRSIHLLKSLGSERERWELSSEGFRAQMDTIIGDVMLSSAFLAYAGNESERRNFSERDKKCRLCCNHINIRPY